MLGLVKPLAAFMCLAVILGVCGFLAAQFITIMGGWAMLDVLKLDSSFSLSFVCIAVIVLAVLRAAFRCTEQYLNHYIAFNVLAIIRGKVFDALRRLCPAKLEGHDKGDLISVITSDIELLEVFYAHTVSPVLIALIMTLIMTVFISLQSIVLGMIALCGYLTVGVAVPVIIYKLSGNAADELRTKSGKLSAFVLDNLRGLDETIRYSAGEKRIGELNERSESLDAQRERLSRNVGLNSAVTNCIIVIFDLAVLFAAIVLYNSGSITFSQLLISVIAMMSSFGPCVALANLGSVLQNTLAAGSRVIDILDEQPAATDITDGENIVFDGAQLESISFSYGEQTILDKLDLTVKKGSITGIVGRSGSGKSTVLKLLMRFWQTSSGEIKISGRNIQRINTASLRENESYVTQDTQMFNDTIEYNVRIAKPDATHEQVVEACKKASIHDFIMTLPKGYETKVGELGDALSGGERQRIGLARAFLHGAAFMMLDEPTSNLDCLNEAVILRSVLETGTDRTVLLVSHRPSTMRICDTVYDIENERMS